MFIPDCSFMLTTIQTSFTQYDMHAVISKKYHEFIKTIQCQKRNEIKHYTLSTFIIVQNLPVVYPNAFSEQSFSAILFGQVPVFVRKFFI